MSLKKKCLLQGRNRDADVENGFVHMEGKERVGIIEREELTYIPYHV